MTFVGFGILGALFPFHTWSPDGHASAPTAVSMLHAGVLMKLGGYGAFRVAIFLLPQDSTRIIMDIYHFNFYKRCLWCFWCCCSKRLKIYQCLLFCESLRFGIICGINDE